MSIEELESMPNNAIVATAASLQRMVVALRDLLGGGDGPALPVTPEQRRQDAAGSKSSMDAIIEELVAAKRSGVPLSQVQDNVVNLAQLGRTASALAEEPCPVCYSDVGMDDAVVMPGCCHASCVGCMRENILEKVRSAQTKDLVCMSEECDTPIPPDMVRRLLSGGDYKADLDKYERFSLDSFLDGTGVRMICPQRECQASFLVEHTSPRVVCPHCHHAFCGHCPGKPDYHHESSCEAYQDWARENGRADDAFEAMLRDKKSRIKPCPKCKGPVFKPRRAEGGACNHMTCTCGHGWCWLCGISYVPGHFNHDGPCHGKQFWDDPAE